MEKGAVKILSACIFVSSFSTFTNFFSRLQQEYYNEGDSKWKDNKEDAALRESKINA